jgi:hypothetical protein
MAVYQSACLKLTHRYRGQAPSHRGSPSTLGSSQSRVLGQTFAMGPPLRGMWWESTAVTDVALQGKALALKLTKI